MQIKVPNVVNNRSTDGFVILSEGSESKDLLPSPRSTVKSRERFFDCALRAPLRMTAWVDCSLRPQGALALPSREGGSRSETGELKT